MVKKKKTKKDKGFKLPKLRKRKVLTTKQLITLRGRRVPSTEITKTLQSRKEKTAQKILDSMASPVAKARARQILGL